MLTAGVSLFVTRNAVIKADYQRYRADSWRNRLNLGVRLQFLRPWTAHALAMAQAARRVRAPALPRLAARRAAGRCRRAIAPARADTVYLEPEQFLAEVLGQVPKPQALWPLAPQIQQAIVAVLDGFRTARRACAIGETRTRSPGFSKRSARSSDHGRVRGAQRQADPHQRADLPREPRRRGVQQRSFVRQFDGAALADGGRLDRRIDGITGWVIDRSAMQRMARLALLLTERLPPG